jgi:hypothetical protein
VPCEATEEFGVFGHAAHVNLKEGKALLERGELLEKLFLGELLFQEAAVVLVVSADTAFHNNAPMSAVRDCCGNRLVYEMTQTVQERPEPSPNC